MTMPTTIPAPCPCCGATSLAPEQQRSTLLAICDALVLKSLEKLGSLLVRRVRGRYEIIGQRPRYLAHTMWPADDEQVERGLKQAWDIVPLLLDSHGCSGVTSLQVTQMLDDYVHDLVITGTPHTVEELKYRFESRLGLPVFDRSLEEVDEHVSHAAV